MSHARGGYVAGSSSFTVMANNFVTEFAEFSETFRKKLHSNINLPHCKDSLSYQCLSDSVVNTSVS